MQIAGRQAEPHCIDNSWHPKTCTADHASALAVLALLSFLEVSIWWHARRQWWRRGIRGCNSQARRQLHRGQWWRRCFRGRPGQDGTPNPRVEGGVEPGFKLFVVLVGSCISNSGDFTSSVHV